VCVCVCVCVCVSGVLFSVGVCVCVCDLLIFLRVLGSTRVDPEGVKGLTPVVSFLGGHAAVVAALLTRGANISHADGRGLTPMGAAQVCRFIYNLFIQTNHIPIYLCIHLFIASFVHIYMRGANISHADGRGLTPMGAAQV